MEIPVAEHGLSGRKRFGVGDRVEEADSPAARRAERHEGSGDRRRAGNPEVRGRQVRLHVDLQCATRVAGHDQLHDAIAPATLAGGVLREPEKTGLAVGEGPERLADDDGLGAAAADPALDGPVGMDDPRRARPGRGRPADGDDGRQHEQVPPDSAPRRGRRSAAGGHPDSSCRIAQIFCGVIDVDVAHAEVPEGIDDGIGDGRRGAHGGRLADALGADGMVR
jgi:hypothetical protein